MKKQEKNSRCRSRRETRMEEEDLNKAYMPNAHLLDLVMK